MILEAFECPIVKRGKLQSYLILSNKGVFKNRNVFFTLKGWFQLQQKCELMWLMLKYFFRVKREKNELEPFHMKDS